MQQNPSVRNSVYRPVLQKLPVLDAVSQYRQRAYLPCVEAQWIHVGPPLYGNRKFKWLSCAGKQCCGTGSCLVWTLETPTPLDATIHFRNFGVSVHALQIPYMVCLLVSQSRCLMWWHHTVSVWHHIYTLRRDSSLHCISSAQAVIQLYKDSSRLPEMKIYSGVSCYFWECTLSR